MKTIIKLLLKFTLWLFSLNICPALTSDSNFGTIELNLDKPIGNQLKKWRLSLIQIMWGTKKFYICSFNRDFDDTSDKAKYTFKFFKCISLDELFNKNDHIKQIYDEYFTRLCSLSDEEKLSSEKESLCYHLESEKNRIDKSDNKINIYTTIALTVLPIIVSLKYDSILLLMKTNIFLMLLFSLVLYYIFNFLAYLYHYIKVGSYNMSSFKDLKDEEQYYKEKLVAQYYFDYQSLKNKAEIFVSYVKNIQEMLLAALLFTVVLVCCSYVSYNNSPNSYIGSSNSMILNIDIDSLNDPYTISSIKLTDLKMNIQTKNADKVMVMFNKQTDVSYVKDELLIFEDSFEIQYINDDTLELGKAKILIYKGAAK